MKNLLSLISWSHVEKSFLTLKNRFILSSFIIIFLTGMLLYMVNSGSDSILIIRAILSLIVTFFLSVGITLFLEAWKKKTFDIKFSLLIVAYGLIFFFTVDPNTDWGVESKSYFFLHLTGFLAFLFFSPYLSRLFLKDVENIEYGNYFSRIAWIFLMSAIVGGSLIALGFIAIASVLALFDITNLVDDTKLYGNWATFALALVTPFYSLLSLPHLREIDKKTYEINRFFSFLIRYIAVPFIFIYFLILYAYSAKVLMNFQDWPKGMISWMVIGFSTFGYLTYIFSKPYEDTSSILRVFRRYFPYMVIPQIFMLGYAIELRIAQYDLTMNRYFVVIFGIWLMIISLYLIVSRKKSLAIITASLTLISLIISVGPWSVYSVPLERQYARLIRNLESAKILQVGVVHKLDHSIEITLENDIYSGIEYICEFSECDRIKSLFSDQVQLANTQSKKNWNDNTYNAGKMYPGITKWEVINAVTTGIGVSRQYDSEEPSLDTRKYLSFTATDIYNAYNPEILFPIDITGYDRILRVYGEGSAPISPLSTESISVSVDTARLVLRSGSGVIGISTRDFDTTLLNKYLKIENANIGQQDMTFLVSTGGIDMKIIFQSYAIRNPKYTAKQTPYDSYGVSGYALIRGGK